MMALVQSIADIGRIPDERVHQLMIEHGHIFVRVDYLMGAGMMLTVFQIGFAAGAMDPWTLPACVVGFFMAPRMASKCYIPPSFVYPDEGVFSSSRRASDDDDAVD